MSKMILVSQVAALGRQLEKAQTRGIRDSIMQPTQIPSWSLRSLMDDTTENGDPDPPAPAMQAPPSPSGSIADNVIDPCNRDPYTGTLKDSERIKILQLLDEWEEPERRLESPVSVDSYSLLFILSVTNYRYSFAERDYNQCSVTVPTCTGLHGY